MLKTTEFDGFIEDTLSCLYNVFTETTVVSYGDIKPGEVKIYKNSHEYGDDNFYIEIIMNTCDSNKLGSVAGDSIEYLKPFKEAYDAIKHIERKFESMDRLTLIFFVSTVDGPFNRNSISMKVLIDDSPSDVIINKYLYSNNILFDNYYVYFNFNSHSSYSLCVTKPKFISSVTNNYETMVRDITIIDNISKKNYFFHFDERQRDNRFFYGTMNTGKKEADDIFSKFVLDEYKRFNEHNADVKTRYAFEFLMWLENNTIDKKRNRIIDKILNK